MDGLEGVPTPGGLWNGSFLEQGVKAGSNGFTKLLPTIAANVLKEGGQIAEHKFADAVIKKAVERTTIKTFFSSLAKKGSLFLYLLLSPDFDSPKPYQERPFIPHTLPQPLPSPKFEPQTNKPKGDDDRIHEQYVLEAGEEGDFDVMIRGQKEPQSKVHLKVGDVWKYGTTVNPEKRYTQKWLKEKKLLKFRQSEGTRSEVLTNEKEKIIQYRIENGKLPPGNKQTN